MRFLLILMLASALGLVPALAGEPIALGEALRLPSKVLGEERTLLVSTPLGYQGGTERYPVVYFTDGAEHLRHLRGSVDFLVRNGFMPDVILVGVTHTDRTRDLTPTHGYAQRLDGSKVDLPSSGGGGVFIEFLRKELFPFVEANYRTEPCRIFAGHSFGALLALHVLATTPDFFQGYIAASPALGWDEDYALRVLTEGFKGRKELPRTVFVTMANEEAGEPRPNRFDRLRQLLGRTKAEGFAWEAKALPEEDHRSGVLLAYYWGLRKVFEGWKLPLNPQTAQFEGDLDTLKQHFAKLGKRLGYAIPLAEEQVNLVGYHALAQKKPKVALEFFRFNVQAHPASPNAQDSLGEALEAAGQSAEALGCYQKAIELAQASAHPGLAVFTRHRDRLAAKLPKP